MNAIERQGRPGRSGSEGTEIGGDGRSTGNAGEVSQGRGTQGEAPKAPWGRLEAHDIRENGGDLKDPEIERQRSAIGGEEDDDQGGDSSLPLLICFTEMLME